MTNDPRKESHGDFPLEDSALEELLRDAGNLSVPNDVEDRLRERLSHFKETIKNDTTHSPDPVTAYEQSPDSHKEDKMSTIARPARSSRFETASRNTSSARSFLYIVPAIFLLIGLAGAIFFFATQGKDNGVADNSDEKKEVVAPNDELLAKKNAQQNSVTANKLHRQILDDGTIVIAQSGTKYEVKQRREIVLESGDLYLIVAKSDEAFVVHTDDGEVRATGTRFAVSANEATSATSAAVAQGTVILASNAGEIKLGSGQQGSLTKGARPTRQAAPRLSHVVSWAKEALAQQEKIVEVTNKENGLIAVDPWGQETRLSLRKFNVDVYIEDGIARTTIDQTFFNHNPWNGEGTFYFPLPPDASVSRLAMYVNGQLNEGGMVTREKGAQIYAEALYSNRDPALLEMMEGNMFKMRIFPLEGRQEKRVFLSYTQKLDDLYNTTKYWFPMDHSHSVAGELAINVRVKDGAKYFDPQSSTHDVKVSSEGDDLVLQYDAEKIKPDQDFLLSLLSKTDAKKVDDKKQSDSRISTFVQDDEHYFFARINPELEGTADTRPRQWIILNDVSASRSKIDLQAQQHIMRRLIAEADDLDSVFRIDLNTEAINVSNEPVSVRSKIAAGIADHEPQVLIGGTNIEAGFEAIKNAIDRHSMDNPYVLYVGDGVATDGEKKVSELPFKIPKGVTFVGVGVGKNIDKLFLQDAADRTGGMFANINPDEDIDWRVFDLVSALNTPRMVGIDVLLFDENDKRLDAIAYPSSRGLAAGESLTVVGRCEKKLPTSIVYRGKVNGKTVAFSSDLKNAKKESQYIPRFWAKRHIDQLLKSDMPRKDEIVELSQQYYVVTPFTSLIVLEDDAMYAKYNVERGREDHWALYNAPKKIEVVKEEIDWNRWSWYGNFKGEDGKVKTSSQPKTIQEIVDSIQIRINAPFYYYPPQPKNDSRTSLYHLAAQAIDEKNDPSKLLTLWFLLASGERKPLVDWNRSVSGGDDEGVIGESGNGQGQTAQSMSASRKPSPQLARLAQQNAARGGMLRQFSPNFNSLDIPSRGGRGGGRPQLVERQKYLVRQEMLVERVSESIVASSGKKRMISPSAFLSASMGAPSLAPIPGEIGRAFQQAVATRWSRLNRDVEKYNRQHNYMYWGGRFGDYGGSLDLNDSQSWWGNNSGLDELLGNLEAGQDGKEADKEPMMDSFMSLKAELMPMNRPVPADGLQPLNMMFDMEVSAPASQLFGTFQNGDSLSIASFSRFESRVALMGESLRTMNMGPGMGGGGGGGGGGGLGFMQPASNLDVAPQGIAAPLMMFPRPEFKTRHIRTPTLMQLSQSPVKSQPGMTAILAADFLHRRHEKLTASIESIEDAQEKSVAQAELKAIEAAIANIDKAAVRLEDTGKFWGWNAWSYHPQSHSYNMPQIQAYQGYNWSFDLTRYADGLYSTTLDMVDEVIAEYGTTKPLGKVDDDAAKRIAKARDNVKTVEIRFSEDGQKVIVASNDRYATSRQNEMYLEEQIVCDGKNFYQIYDSLGLVAKRKATDLRLSMLRSYTPHLLEPADSLANFFDVTLHAEDESSFTLKLSAPEIEDEEADSEVADNEDEKESDEGATNVHLLVKVDFEGRLLEKHVVVDDEVTFKMEFDYNVDDAEDQVAIRWFDREGEELHSSQYFAKSVDDKDGLFAVNTNDRIVFDMPLRKPSYYLERLQKIAEGKQGADDKGGEEGDETHEAKTAIADTDGLDGLTYSKENADEAIQLKRHQALALLQSFDWRRYGQQNGAAIHLLDQVAKLQKRRGEKLTLGDVTLIGSAGQRNLGTTLKDYRDLSKQPTAQYFQSRNSGFAKWNEDFSEVKGLVGHLAAYHVATQASSKTPAAFKEFAKQYEDSPLMLALAQHVYQHTGRIDSWVALNKQPRWSGFALLMATNYLQNADQQKKFADEFWRWREELAEDDLEPVILPNLATILRNHSDKGKLTEMLASQFEKAKKTDSIPILMEFAEYVASLSEDKIADQALALVRDKLKLDDDPVNEESIEEDSNLQLIKRFAYAQTLWVGRRNREALDQFNLILEQLESKGVKPSPAFLGSTARLAQQAGDAQRAFELEEQALVAEQPYLPDMINLQAFRQRYQWLWSQYTTAIKNIDANDKDREAKIDKLIARIEATWIRWYEVDRDNTALPGQMATLLENAGREEQSWKYLSTTIDRKPRDAQSYYQLGVWYASNGQPEEAVAWHAQAPQWDTANPQWIYHHGMALKNVDKHDEANAQFKKIVDGTWAPGLQGWVNNAQQQMTTSQ